MKSAKAAFCVPGGVHPRYHKDRTRDNPIAVMPLPPLLRVSMAQHMGAPAKPLVKKGDAVLRGQPIGEAAGFISAAVHAPTSGTVKAVADAPVPAGGFVPAVEIEPDGQDAWIPDIEAAAPARKAAIDALLDNPSPDRAQAVQLVARAGIVGMGGAGFPTHVKLSPPPDKPIETLIINGAECEPYLTADHRLMVERAADIFAGARILQAIVSARSIRIAIESNKPDAVEAMLKATEGVDADIQVVVLKTEYPQGAEKQQIFSITGRQVPSGGLPMDVGALVENVGTTLAVWDAALNGRPLTERVTTITGSPVSDPRNVLARIGTSYAELLDFCGGANAPVAKILSGGPMMGLAVNTLDITTTKTTSGLVALAPSEVSQFSSMPCISCGRCVDACPMNLVPSELSQLLEAEDYESAEALNVLDCIECGCCAFECPARRPLVQHMRRGKGWVTARRRAAQQAQRK